MFLARFSVNNPLFLHVEKLSMHLICLKLKHGKGPTFMLECNIRGSQNMWPYMSYLHYKAGTDSSFALLSPVLG